jgi:GT2 family glycosyltransferase
MSFPKIFIIILNWNGLQDTLECLESVFKLNYPNYRVLVVDNGSTDDSVKIIERNYPKVILILNGENLGFAGGNNVGIKYALGQGAQYIWLLNNDTIVDPDALLNMMTESEKRQEIGMAGSKIYYYNYSKKIWFAGAKINWAKGVSVHIGQGETDIGQYDYIKQVDRVTGCSMLVKKSVCERVGLFDEKYFLYVEEIDWCVRARKAGFLCIYVPSSMVYHKESVSASGTGNWENLFYYYNTRNFLYLIEKSFCFPVRQIILLRMILGKLMLQKRNILRMAYSFITSFHGLKPHEAPVLFGIRDFLIRKMGKADYSFS